MAPSGTRFNWAGMRLGSGSGSVRMVGFEDDSGVHALLVVEGESEGNAEVGTTLHFSTSRGQKRSVPSPNVLVKVGSEIKAAAAELAQIEKLRSEGKKVDPSRESSAKQDAVAVAKRTLGKGSDAAGTEIDTLLRSVSTDIKEIADSRFRGYQGALVHLNLKKLDEEEQAGSVQSFALSLAGNLTWALSGLIALTPVGFGAELAAAVLQQMVLNRGRLAVAVGTAGAILAQFANGLPSGGSPASTASAPLIAFEAELDKLNTTLRDTTQWSLHSTLLALLEAAPPGRGVDARRYAGRLETAVRQVLFGGYFMTGGATGNDIKSEVIQKDAENQLLRRVILTSGKISGKGLGSTKLDKGGLGKMVGPAVDLIGGPEAAKLGDYEFVTEQIHRAARELGLRIPAVTSEQIREDFAGGDKIVLLVSWILDQSGSPEVHTSRRWSKLDVSVLSLDKGYPEWLWEHSIPQVYQLEIRKKDLSKANLGKDGGLAYSAERFWIRLYGTADASVLMNPGPPSLLWLKYEV